MPILSDLCKIRQCRCDQETALSALSGMLAPNQPPTVEPDAEEKKKNVPNTHAAKCILKKRGRGGVHFRISGPARFFHWKKKNLKNSYAEAGLKD